LNDGEGGGAQISGWYGHDGAIVVQGPRGEVATFVDDRVVGITLPSVAISLESWVCVVVGLYAGDSLDWLPFFRLGGFHL